MSTNKENSRHFLQSQPFCVPVGEDILNVELTCPGNEVGVIVFTEEATESRDPCNEAIAEIFAKHNLATLLPDDPAFAEPHLDTRKTAERLECVALWAQQEPETAALSLGCFAAGDHAPAALIAAAQRPDLFKAVVLRGGRPDQVLEYLPLVKAPVLLIAAGRDPVCLRSNRKALERLNGSSTLNVIPHASQAFQEPGVLEESAQLAALWFLQHL